MSMWTMRRITGPRSRAPATIVKSFYRSPRRPYYSAVPVDSKTITEALQAIARGDEKQLDLLVPVVYREMKRLASSYLRKERPGHTLQPTALAHEAYLRLVGREHIHWQNRAHFLGVAAGVMREILVDHARRRKAQKRGGGHPLTLFDEALAVAGNRPV